MSLHSGRNLRFLVSCFYELTIRHCAPRHQKIQCLPMNGTPERHAYEPIEQAVDNCRLPRVSRASTGFSRNDVINAFSDAFRIIGGVQRLALWANANPDKFYPLYAKLLPSTAINIGTSGPVIIEHALPPTALDQHDIDSISSDLPRAFDQE